MSAELLYTVDGRRALPVFVFNNVYHHLHGPQMLSSVFKVAANAGVPTGRNGGLTIGNKVRMLSPNHPDGKELGGTLLKIGSKYENIRFDVGSESLFHMNIQFSKSVNYHVPIGTLGAGFLGGILHD